MKRVQCPKCGVTVEFDDKSGWEGNRDFEEVNCPNCDEYLARVFTDRLPNPHIIKNK